MQLHKILENISLADYPQKSRVHRLKSFDTLMSRCFVKREDELGFSISGSKVRKYLSLIPYLIEKGFEEAVVLGSPFSNHVLSISQLLKENGISPALFLVGDKPKEKIGNYLLTSLVVQEERMHFFPRSAWDNIEDIAKEHCKGKKSCVISLGASMKEALPGALTLSQDILRNEKELGISFSHIFIDAGTGMMAASLILGLSFLQKEIEVHVVQVAELSLEETLDKWQKEFEALMGPLTSRVPYHCYQPKSARSFGSVNKELFEGIRNLAEKEGFFTDPIYTAKLFQTGKEILIEKKLSGNVLFIHSGGALSLMGFQKMFQ